MIHHTAEGESVTGSIFWSFMILVFFIPSAIALVMIGILVHLVNYVSNNKLIFHFVTLLFFNYNIRKKLAFISFQLLLV